MRACCCLLLAIPFVLANTSALGGETTTPCQDVTRLDFKNLTISNTIHHNTRRLAFKDGIALTYDDPMTKNSSPDWKAEIERDTAIHPSSGTTVRFLSVHESHLTGSGWNYWLVGYSCSNGQLRQVFSRDGLSLKIERLDNSGIVVSKIMKDSSRTATHWTYVWDMKLSTYVLASSWSDTDSPSNRNFVDF